MTEAEAASRGGAKTRLHDSEARLAFLLKLSDALLPVTDALEIQRVASHMLVEHLAVQRAGYGEVEGEEVVVRIDSSGALPSMTGRIPTRHFGAELAELYRHGGTAVMRNAATHPGLTEEERARFHAARVAAHITVGIQRTGEPVIALGVHSEEPRDWSELDIALLRDVAGRTWAATARVQSEAALRESERWLQTLMEGVPQLVWRAVDDGQWTWASPQWTAYTGQAEPESHGAGWLDPVHPEDRPQVEAIWGEARQRGAFQADYRIRGHKDGRHRFFQTRATPVRDAGGGIVEWLGTSTDVQDLRELDERHRLLLAELQHRVRNILAMVRAMVRQSMGRYDDLEDYVAHLVGRIDAMGRTQVLLTRAADSRIDLESLVRDELRAHAADESLLTIAGPKANLSAKAAEALTLAVHELATNSVKYGALSHGKRLAIEWDCHDRAGTKWLELVWREDGGAPASAAGTEGFGTELIERRVPYELRGEASIVVNEKSVLVRIAFPLVDGSSIFETGPLGEETDESKNASGSHNPAGGGRISSGA